MKSKVLLVPGMLSLFAKSVGMDRGDDSMERY